MSQSMKKQNNVSCWRFLDEKTLIAHLYAQLGRLWDEQLSNMDDQLRVKDVQIAEKDKQIDQQQQLTLTAMKDKGRA